MTVRKWGTPGITLTALAVLGYAGYCVWNTPPPRISYDNYRRIQVGMSLDEVESLLGEPFIYLLSDEGRDERGNRLPFKVVAGANWYRNGVCIFVSYNDRNFVTEARFEVISEQRSPYAPWKKTDVYISSPQPRTITDKFKNGEWPF